MNCSASFKASVLLMVIKPRAIISERSIFGSFLIQDITISDVACWTPSFRPNSCGRDMILTYSLTPSESLLYLSSSSNLPSPSSSSRLPSNHKNCDNKRWGSSVLDKNHLPISFTTFQITFMLLSSMSLMATYSNG